MKKLKIMIASLIGAIALAFAFVFTSNVNAYSVSSDNKTASWIRNTARTGLLLGNSTTYSSATFSEPSTSEIAIKNKMLLIPVPSSSSAGTLTLVDDNTKTRYARMLTSTGTVTSTDAEKIQMGTTAGTEGGNSFVFDSSYVINRESLYYIGVSATDDFKIHDITVALTSSDSYVTQCTVNYYAKNADVSTDKPIFTENVDSGANASCNVHIWGKTITGYFSNAACTETYVSGAITTATNIFCEVEDSVINPNIITNSMISEVKQAFSLPTSGTTTTELTSVYTIQPSISIKTVTVNETNYDVFQSNGSTSVSSGNVTKAFKVTTTTSGKFYIVANGNGNERTFTLVSSTLPNESSYGEAISTSDTIGKTGLNKIELTVPNAGSYYIVLSGTTNIFSFEFVEDAAIYWQQGEDAASDLIRVIGVIGNVKYESGNISNIEKVTFTYTKYGTTTVITKPVSNVYSQINKGTKAYELGYVSFAAHDNKLYAVYQFGGYEDFHAAGKSMDISINIYFTGSETPVTATKTIA